MCGLRVPAVVDDNVEITPRGKLSLPVADGGEWNYHEERTANAGILRESEGGQYIQV